MKRPKNLKYGKMQTGGLQPRIANDGTPGQVYQSQAQLDAEQAWLDNYWKKSDPTGLGVRPRVGRNIGDPVLPIMGQGNAPRKLPTTWPADAQIFSESGATWYNDPHTGDLVDIDPVAYAGSRPQATKEQQAMDLAKRNMGMRMMGGKLQRGGTANPAQIYQNRVNQMKPDSGPVTPYYFIPHNSVDSSDYTDQFNDYMNASPNRRRVLDSVIDVNQGVRPGWRYPVDDLAMQTQDAQYGKNSKMGQFYAGQNIFSPAPRDIREDMMALPTTEPVIENGTEMYAKQKPKGKAFRMQGGRIIYQQGGFLPQRPFGNFNQPLQESDVIPGVNAPMPDLAPQDTTDRRGIWQDYVNSDIRNGYNVDPKKTPATPQNWARPLGIGMMAIRTLGREIAGRVARGRQNQYDYEQQSALGMMNPMPVDDYQPTPYNLYAKMGGLQHHKFFGPKFSNGANFKFSDGEKYDKLVVNRRIIPDLLNLRRRGR